MWSDSIAFELNRLIHSINDVSFEKQINTISNDADNSSAHVLDIQ